MNGISLFLERIALRRRRITVILHLEPFDFRGIDRFQVLEEPIATVRTPIPFRSGPTQKIDEIFDPRQHLAMDGREGDVVHRFPRPNANGIPLDFLVKDGRIIQIIDNARAYSK